jgi:hypothetical protein
MENDEKICIVSDAFDIVSPHVPKAIRKMDDARRIVQCVNDCADMKDPAKEIAQLRADRAELLEFVKEVSDLLVNPATMYKHVFNLNDKTMKNRAEQLISRIEKEDSE